MKLYEPISALILTVLLVGGFWFGVRGEARHDETRHKLDLTIQKTAERMDRIATGMRLEYKNLDALRKELGDRVFRLEDILIRGK